VLEMVYLYVGIGGTIGSVLRYFVSCLSLPTFYHFPMGTLFVNLLGAFVLGWFVARVAPLQSISQEVKAGISTGIIGSFTTFSTLSVEVIQLIQDSFYLWLFLYLSISVVGGLILTAIGFSIGQGKTVGMEDI
jgi:fluoride exporter